MGLPGGPRTGWHGLLVFVSIYPRVKTSHCKCNSVLTEDSSLQAMLHRYLYIADESDCFCRRRNTRVHPGGRTVG